MMSLYLIIALICYIAYRAASGADNGLLYSERLGITPAFYSKYGVHEIEVIQTTIVGIGFWAAGIDLIQLIAGWFVASPLFKGLINLGTDRPFLDPDETSDVDQDGRPGYRLFGITIPSLGHGYGRVVLAIIGLVVIIAWPLGIEKIGLYEYFPLDMENFVRLIISFFR